MGAPKGNTYNKKYQTQKERKELCEQVCEHLRKGLSQECFSKCDWDTVERVIKDHPKDFPADRLRQARKKGREFWEKIGVRQSVTGKGSAASWKFNMANRYGWAEKQDHTTGGKQLGVIVLPELNGNEENENT